MTDERDEEIDDTPQLPEPEVFEDDEGNIVHRTTLGPFTLPGVDGQIMIEVPDGYRSKDDLETEVELLRARLDATTRAALWVEAEDRDEKLALVRAPDLDAAHGAARRNRENLELGDDY